MLEFKKTRQRIILVYESEWLGRSANWVYEDLRTKREAELVARSFTFKVKDLLDSEQYHAMRWREADGEVYRISFVLGEAEGDYYRIPARILGTSKDVLLSKEMKLERKTFVAYKDISIFGRLGKLVTDEIIIGGAHENAIPLEEYARLLAHFPNSTEVKHYAAARIEQILRDYIGTPTDSERKLRTLLEKRESLDRVTRTPELYRFELDKYEYIRDSIAAMLDKPAAYTETQWQKIILDFLLLIFPKYVAVLKDVEIEDHYSKAGKVTKRKLDFALVDANGHLDIVEIKQPFEACLITSRPSYRDNHSPKSELSGTVMQAEKYLFHLNKWGIAGEKALTAKHAKSLPNGMTEIRVTSPKAILIMGRSYDFKPDKQFDFEIIKRKYANILDIITYDDLLKRLDNIIAKFERVTTTGVTPAKR